jgi:hypothetical protein
MIVLKELIEAGKVTPVIDRTYPLSKSPGAIRYLNEGRARGKVVITVRGAVAQENTMKAIVYNKYGSAHCSPVLAVS